MLNQVSNTLLTPSNLSTKALLKIFDMMSHRNIDYADLYFQLSQDESWVLEDGIIKEGGFHIDRGVGVEQFLVRKQALLMPIKLILLLCSNVRRR